MSSNMSTGQIAGYVIGAVVGYFSFGTGYALGASLASSTATGAAIGGAIGGALDPVSGPAIVGPRLNDLSVQTSTYGASIPRIYGSVATMGNVFWLENDQLREVEDEDSQGGKGGGGGSSITTFAYYATFAVGLCRGPIGGVRRIWIGGELWYDAGSDDFDTIVESNRRGEGFQVYFGTDDQDPEPRMQADKGADNVSAYPGLAYIVFYDLALAPYANSLLGAQVKVEVVQAPEELRVIAQSYEVVGTTEADGSPRFAGHDYGRYWLYNNTTGYSAYSLDGKAWVTDPDATAGNAAYVGYYATRWYATPNGGGDIEVSETGAFYEVEAPDNLDQNGMIFAGSDETLYAIAPNTATIPRMKTSDDGVTWAITDGFPAVDIDWAQGYSTTDEQTGIVICGGGEIDAPSGAGALILGKLTGWETIYPDSGITAYYGVIHVEANRYMAYGNGGVVVTDDMFDTYTVYAHPGVTFVSGAWNGTEFMLLEDTTVGAAGSLDAYFTATGETLEYYELELPAGQQATHILSDGDGIFCALSYDFGGGPNYSTLIVRQTAAMNQSVTLASIVEAESLLAEQLSPSDIDASDLTDLVRGYRVTGPAAIRAGIETLFRAWPFDVLQSGYQVRFVRRGGSSLATVPAEDLDARPDGDAPGTAMATAREMDSMLARQVRVTYLDQTREYDLGEQQSPERVGTTAASNPTIEFPIVMTASEAAGAAEVLLYMQWQDRYTYTFRLPYDWTALEPGDVVTVAGVEMVLRQVVYLPDGRLECTAKPNRAGVYIPTLPGIEPSVIPPGTIPVPAATDWELMDTPTMRDADNTTGWPLAMSGASATWAGGLLYRSIDDGQTWVRTNSVAPPGALMGIAQNTIGVGRTDIIDAASVLTVIFGWRGPSSCTELAMLNGANHFAYGRDGRWEIIAARTVTPLPDGERYYLQDMLRGRFGTEWAMGLHAGGDRVIALDTSALQWVTMSADVIGAQMFYRGLTVGSALSEAATRALTYRAVNLKPLSPVYANGYLDFTNLNWIVTFHARTRVGGAWRDLVDASMGEAVESYEIDVMDGATVVRTITSGTQGFTYTSAQQIADFGGAVLELDVNIYQMSATVGRGYPLAATLTSAAPPASTLWAVGHATTPFITIYSGGIAGFVKTANPDTLPPNTGRKPAFSAAGGYLAATSSATPYVVIYSRSGTTFTKLANPATLPTGPAFAACWSSDDAFLAVAHNTAPRITIYSRSGDTFTKTADPATLPPSDGRGCDFAPDTNHLAVAHASSPYLTVYSRSGTTFTKIANPATLPGGTGNAAKWSPDGAYLAVAHDTTPWLTVYGFSGGVLTKLANPATLPGSNCNGVCWSPDGAYLFVALDASPYIAVYALSAGVLTRQADPATLPGSQANDVDISPDGAIITLALNASPYTAVYSRSGGTLTKLSDPDINPTGIANGVALFSG